MEHVVELQNVSKSFHGFSINNVDLQIKKGFITGLIGANGAGKSTVLKMMMNLVKPDQGEVNVFGLDYSKHEKEIKERIGFVYDGNVFFEGLNLKDIKRIIAPAYRRWDNELFMQYIDQFELPMNKSIRTFSKGMQMKASLALALSHHAELILMDEPTAGLDPIFRRELLALLQQLMLDEQRTILFSTHITTDLDKIADYITFMRRGKVVFNQSVHEISQRYYIVKGDVELLDRDTEQYFIHIQRGSHTFEALTEGIDEVRTVFGQSVVTEPASLEDIMYYLKGELQHV